MSTDAGDARELQDARGPRDARELQDARELWFEGPREVRVRRGAVPVPGEGQVRARAIVSGISQGTELLLYCGDGPTPFDASLDVGGASTYPRRYGYAWVGEIDAIGARVASASAARGASATANGPAIGARVFALAPHGDVHVVDASSVRPLSEAIPPSRAVLAANLETAITCVWDAGASLGDAVVVLGGGIVGLLVAWLCRASGARVTVVERSPRRRDLARLLGADDAIAPEDDRPRGDADVVIEATGDPSSLDRAIAHAGREAAIVVASFYGARVATVALGDAFHRRRLALRATQVSAIPPARSARWDAARRFDLVRRLLESEVLDALIDPPVPFDRAPDAYARLAASPGDAGQVVFAYR